MNFNYLKNFMIRNWLLLPISFVVYLIFYSILLIDSSHFCFLDDLYEIIPPMHDNKIQAIVDSLAYCYHGKVLSAILGKFLGFYLPSEMGIHINTWYQSGGAILRGVIMVLLSFLIASLSFLYKKINILFPIFALSVFIIIQSLLNSSEYRQVVYTFLYGYIAVFIPFCIYFRLLILHFKKNYISTSKRLFLFCLISFIVGHSCEVLNITSFYFLFLLMIFSKKINKNISIKPILYSYFTLIMGMLTLYLHPAFSMYAKNKGMSTSIIDTFSNIKEIFLDFNTTFINVIINEFSPYLIFILILFTFIYLLNKDNSYKIQINNIHWLSIILAISTLLYSYTLILIGPNPEQGSIYYLNFFDLVFQQKVIFISIIFFQLGLVLIKPKIFIVTIIAVLTLLVNRFKSNITEDIQYIRTHNIKNYAIKVQNIDYMMQRMRKRYILERIFIFYLYSNKIPTILQNEETNKYFYYKDSFTYTYMYYTYKIPIQKLPKYYEVNWVMTFDEVLKEYYNNGGPIITEEEIIDANYQKLLDKEYVLNGINIH